MKNEKDSLENIKNEDSERETTKVVDIEQEQKEFNTDEKPRKMGPSVFDQLQTPVEESKEDSREESIEDAMGGGIEEDSNHLENNFEDLDDEEMEGLFQDHKLMAELGVEIIDLVATYGCMAIANEKDESQWTVSAARRNRLKKPLALLLKNREAKVKPEIMILVIILSVYAPMIYKAVKKKMEATKSKKEKVEAQSKQAPHVENHNRQQIIDRLKFKQQQQPQNEDPVSPFEDMDKDEKRKKAYLMKIGGANTKQIMQLLNLAESTVYKYVKEGEEIVKKEAKK